MISHNSIQRDFASSRKLLRIIRSWYGMIENYHKTGEKYPTAVLNDLEHSIRAVLREEGINV